MRLSDPHDITLLEAVSRGEFAISGFRNRDIRRPLHPSAHDASPSPLLPHENM